MSFKNLNNSQLKKLYSDFVYYRDEVCNVFSDISTKQFYSKNSKKYESVKLNQCDGCDQGLTVITGCHRLENGQPVMVCAAWLYA